ncbi:hypothetical protein RND81_01G041500 [Saponaria officinalis]|uniref:Uncharacterized protein n=1 Tax=Saponaria officinalis TaxID=3572 RepID=A0AAW1N8M4_SAPOF
MQIVSSKFDGKLNILVNNTGMVIRKQTQDYTSEEYSAIMATNFESAYHFCQLAHPLLKASGFGCIIMISSISGLVSVGAGSVYEVSKGIIL